MWQGVAWHGKMWQDEYVNRPKAGLCPAFGLLLVAEAEEATDNFEEYPEAEPDPLLIAVGWTLTLSKPLLLLPILMIDGIARRPPLGEEAPRDPFDALIYSVIYLWTALNREQRGGSVAAIAPVELFPSSRSTAGASGRPRLGLGSGMAQDWARRWWAPSARVSAASAAPPRSKAKPPTRQDTRFLNPPACPEALSVEKAMGF